MVKEMLVFGLNHSARDEITEFRFLDEVEIFLSKIKSYYVPGKNHIDVAANFFLPKFETQNG